MQLEKHHKIILGGFTGLVIIYMIINSIFLYMLFIQTEANYNSLDKDLKEFKADTNTKITELTQSILETKENLGETIIKLDEIKASASSDFSGIIENALEGVVTIKTDISQGTGFIIQEEGYVVTNYHVIDGAKSAAILTSDSKSHRVEIIGYSEKMDLALLKIDGDFDALRLGNSNEVKVGEKVIAIGNPLGLQFSVTEGIVSAVHRQGINEVSAYIQTDAALNPGNSGGPLINTNGEAIGMNNFKIGDSESIGFALESNYIKSLVNEISEKSINQTLI